MRYTIIKIQDINFNQPVTDEFIARSVANYITKQDDTFIQSLDGGKWKIRCDWENKIKFRTGFRNGSETLMISVEEE